MQHFENRVSSFNIEKGPYAWLKSRGKNTLTPEKLADAGFYFTPSNSVPDKCTCYICGEKTRLPWLPEDVPIETHADISPNCPLVITKLKAKQLGKRGASISIDELSDARLRTFRNWPYESKTGYKIIKAENLAAAGFIYFSQNEDNNDSVTCTLCNLELDGWEPEDDPRIEHQKRRPECPFFKLTEDTSKSKVKVQKEVKSHASKRALEQSDDDAIVERVEQIPVKPKSKAKGENTTITNKISKVFVSSDDEDVANEKLKASKTKKGAKQSSKTAKVTKKAKAESEALESSTPVDVEDNRHDEVLEKPEQPSIASKVQATKKSKTKKATIKEEDVTEEEIKTKKPKATRKQKEKDDLASTARKLDLELELFGDEGPEEPARKPAKVKKPVTGYLDFDDEEPFDQHKLNDEGEEGLDRNKEGRKKLKPSKNVAKTKSAETESKPSKSTDLDQELFDDVEVVDKEGIQKKTTRGRPAKAKTGIKVKPQEPTNTPEETEVEQVVTSSRPDLKLPRKKRSSGADIELLVKPKKIKIMESKKVLRSAPEEEININLLHTQEEIVEEPPQTEKKAKPTRKKIATKVIPVSMEPTIAAITEMSLENDESDEGFLSVKKKGKPKKHEETESDKSFSNDEKGKLTKSASKGLTEETNLEAQTSKKMIRSDKGSEVERIINDKSHVSCSDVTETAEDKIKELTGSDRVEIIEIPAKKKPVKATTTKAAKKGKKNEIDMDLTDVPAISEDSKTEISKTKLTGKTRIMRKKFETNASSATSTAKKGREGASKAIKAALSVVGVVTPGRVNKSLTLAGNTEDKSSEAPTTNDQINSLDLNSAPQVDTHMIPVEDFLEENDEIAIDDGWMEQSETETEDTKSKLMTDLLPIRKKIDLGSDDMRWLTDRVGVDEKAIEQMTVKDFLDTLLRKSQQSIKDKGQRLLDELKAEYQKVVQYIENSPF